MEEVKKIGDLMFEWSLDTGAGEEDAKALFARVDPEMSKTLAQMPEASNVVVQKGVEGSRIFMRFTLATTEARDAFYDTFCAKKNSESIIPAVPEDVRQISLRRSESMRKIYELGFIDGVEYAKGGSR